MKRTPAILAVLAALTALDAGAALVTYKDWDKSPEFVYLTTDAEKKAWKAIQTDDEAAKFIQLFWVKRDPDMKTPANEYKQRFEALVAQADKLFPLGNKRGALTERGKLLILIGPPKSLGQSAKSSVDTGFGSQGTSAGNNFLGTGGATTITYQFLYEQPQLPEWADVKSLDAKFQVDTGTQSEHLIDMSVVKRLEKKAVEMALKNPDLKEPPVYKTREQFEAEQKAANEAAAEAAKGPTLSAPVRAVLDEALAKEKPYGALTLLPIFYANGASRVMVQLWVPASAMKTTEGVKLALLVRTKDGKDAARREEAAEVQKSKNDFFVDRTLSLDPGEYDVAAALLDGAGAVLASAKRGVSAPAMPTEFGASPLFLAFHDFEVAAGKPEDPMVFFVRKFVAKPEEKLSATEDGLAWVVRLYNPGIDPTTKKILLKKEVWVKKAKGGKVEVPQGEQAPIDPPALQGDQKIVLDLAGGIVEKDLGQYFTGDNSVEVKITDTVSGKTITASAPFSIEKKEAPAPPAPAPAKKK